MRNPWGAKVLADSRLYLPWRYASLGKYGRPWVVDQGLYVDLALTALTTRALWSGSAFLVLGMLLLHVSLHAIYEIGYFENDIRAARREAKPTLTEAVEMFRGFPLERHAWIWGATLGVLGCGALGAARSADAPRMLGLLATWAAVLVATRLIFHLYNRQPAEGRLLVYPFLQAAKSFGILALLASSAFGAALIAAQVVLMWMNYAIYRQGGHNKDLPREEVRLVAFMVFGLGIAVADPSAVAEAGPLPLAAMIGWAFWRVIRVRLRQRRKTAAAPHPVFETQSQTQSQIMADTPGSAFAFTKTFHFPKVKKRLHWQSAG